MDIKWNSETQQWVIAGVIVLVVALAAWWLFTRPAADESDTTKTATSTNQTSSTTTSNNARPTTGMSAGESVTVNDQQAGNSVRVVEAQLSRVSWIAVRDDLRIYGATRVNPPQGGGTITDVSVPLLRSTEAGKTYSVVVYADDGDGAFDFKKDALIDGLSDSFSVLSAD